jgi:hypothetical protein
MLKFVMMPPQDELQRLWALYRPELSEYQKDHLS